MGSCGLRTIRDDDGSSYELVLRDCGDHYEGEPQKVIFNHRSGTPLIFEKGSDGLTSTVSAIPPTRRGTYWDIPSIFSSNVPRSDPNIHFSITGEGWVFTLTKPEPPIDDDDDDDEYNKIICETNRETLKKFEVAANREHLRAINSYIEQNNSEALQRYAAFHRDCQKKWLEDGADKKQINADNREAWAVFLSSCLRPYYDSECDCGSRGEDVYKEIYGDIPDTVEEIEELAKARLKEALYS